MTLRRTEEEERAVMATAERLGISKQEAAREAVRTSVDARARFEEVVQRTVARFGPVPDRLK